MTADAVVKSVVVECVPEEAFHYFTEDFGKWWPGHTHSVTASETDGKELPELCVIETRIGGRIYERSANGREHVWGRVLAWEPPARLLFTWHPGRAEDREQTVEILFAKVKEGTRVTLTHSGFERLGERAESVRASYVSGWGVVFDEHYAGFVSRQKEGRK
jgi:uncharacterized protein YndB with AHSA1/START domain